MLFTGRHKILEDMQNCLETPICKYPRASRICTLHGMGGIGKTAIALEYIYRFQGRYNHIFWLTAEDELNLEMSLEKVSVNLSIFDEAQSIQDNVELTLQWFNKAGESTSLRMSSNTEKLQRA